MARPNEYNNLVSVSIKLEYNMVNELKARNINISDACRELLANHVLDGFETEKFVRTSKFDVIPDDVIETMGKRFLEKPWYHQGMIKILYKETGRRFFRRELWDFFKSKHPEIGENKPRWETPEDKGVLVFDKTKYSKRAKTGE